MVMKKAPMPLGAFILPSEQFFCLLGIKYPAERKVA